MRKLFIFHALCVLVISVLLMTCDGASLSTSPSPSPLELEREMFAVRALKEWREMNRDASLSMTTMQSRRKSFQKRFQDRMEQYKKKLSAVKGSTFTCAICVAVVKIIEIQVEENKDAIKEQLMKICEMLPEKAQPVCRISVELLSDELVDMILKKTPPDVVCNVLRIFSCNGCYLQDSKKMNTLSQAENDKRELKAMVLAAILGMRSVIANKRFASNEVSPALDADGDLMPPVHEFVRGADWRGMDCNDNDPNVRPGLRTSDAQVDSNCNGVWGMSPDGKRSYEDIYCNESNNTYTMVMFGDSASSCFHIPPEYLRLQNLSDLIYVLMNEFDYPQLSWSTGFHESIADESIYMNMRERNLCNHRDYQNIGHNGHRMTHFEKIQVPALALNKNSKPLFAFQAYIGNDVCKDTLEKMTKVEDYVRDLKKGLAMLDERAPPGSKLLIQGLVDGRILWNAMSSIQHPFGVTYEELYNFLSCTEANPCQTWLTPNATSRDLTSEHAAKLSHAARKVVETSKGEYRNLELSYMDFPIGDAVKYVESIGKTADVLISPFDGFHLSIYGHRVMAMLVRQFLEKNHPNWLGVSNPYNKHIREQFGDQGGH